MPRLPRFAPAGVAQHIIQRGNNRQPCFCEKQDFGVYTCFLKLASEKYHVDIHAWCFMTNHVHLLATPNLEGSVSLIDSDPHFAYFQ
jgi:REP-associated tyrosine transposase